MLTERLQRLKARVLSDGGATRGVSGYRALARMLAHTKYGAATWGQRRAFMLKALAEIAPLSITDDERLVGEHLFDERTWQLDFGAVFDATAQQQLDATSFDAGTKRQIAEFLRAEQIERSGPAVHAGGQPDTALGGGWGTGVFWAHGWATNHSVRDFEKVIRIGFAGVREEIERARAACDLADPEYPRKTAFWRAAEAVCDAGITLGRRYAEVAANLAAGCRDAARKQELLDIADACRQVPEHGARSFREAVQSLWFTHVLTCAEDTINANSIGRLDQYLYPYFLKDTHAQQLTWDETVEVMAELACKLYRDYDVQQVCLGGQTPRGADGTNFLTYITLEATEELGFVRCMSVRLHRKTPRRLLRQCARMLLKGGGIPFFFNDDCVVEALTAHGIKRGHALTYAPIGCVEITIPGKATPHAVSGALNIAKCLEFALFDGKDLLTGKQAGLATGTLADHATFDGLCAAYRTQVEHFVRLIVECCNQGQCLQIEKEPLPLYSTLTDACIERGRDIHDGGALYNFHEIMLFGVPNVADSLLAVKKLVYDERAVPAAELLAALRQNYGEDEPLRQRLLRLPKYGNDNREVDGLAAEIAEHFCDCLDRHRAPFGGFYAAQLFTFLWHLDFGRQTGATPDGRRAGEPLAYSLSPMQGRDAEGLTAMMNSLARIPHSRAAGSTSAIIEIDPTNFAGEEGIDRLAGVIRTGIDIGIGQMQFNVTTVERLLKAQQDPEHYGNVQVRVSGYSSKFRLLPKDLQDHIIARTKHKE